MIRKLHTPVPGQGLTKLLGKVADLFAERSHHRFRVFAIHFNEQRKARMTLYECCDMGIGAPGNEIPLPVAGHRPILDVGWTVGNRDAIDNMTTA